MRDALGAVGERPARLNAPRLFFEQLADRVVADADAPKVGSRFLSHLRFLGECALVCVGEGAVALVVAERPEQGGAFLRRFFPRYYTWGRALGTLSVVPAFLAADAYTAGACVLVTLLFVYARQILMPRINHARDQEIAGDEHAAVLFRRLHLQSVIINGLQLLLLIATTLYPLWGIQGT